MIIRKPLQRDIPGLRALWKQAFGDTDGFLDCFFSVAFAPERALIATENDKILGALYWLDCLCGEKAFAYIYAVATDREHQGKGVCKALMAEMHTEMAQEGKGTILVPVNENLRAFYRKFGYQDFGGMDEIICFAGDVPVEAEKLTAEQYAQKRKQLLPKGGVLQEGVFLPFLDAQTEFYGGEGWLLAMQKEFAPEFLGERELLPGILKALGLLQAQVRLMGKMPFAMCRGVEENSKPRYFAFALD